MRIDPSSVSKRLLRATALAVMGLLFAPCACRPAAHFDPKRAERDANELWQRVGGELARLVHRKHPDATRVLLIRQAERAELDVGPAQDQMEKAVRNELSKRMKTDPEIVVHALPAVVPPTHGVLMHFSPYRSLDGPTLDGVLKQCGRVSVVISLLGEPPGPAASGTWPPIVCFSRDGSTNLSALIRSGVVSGAVAPRHAEPPRGADDWFELRYEVLDRESIDAW